MEVTPWGKAGRAGRPSSILLYSLLHLIITNVMQTGDVTGKTSPVGVKWPVC